MASTANLRSIASILYGHLLRERPQKTQKYEAGTTSKSSSRKFNFKANKKVVETRYDCRKDRSEKSNKNTSGQSKDIQKTLLSNKLVETSISTAKTKKKPEYLLPTRTLRKRKAYTQQVPSTKVSRSHSSKLPCADKNKTSNNDGEGKSLQLFQCPRLTRSMLKKYCSLTQNFQGEGNQAHEVSSGIKKQRKKEANLTRFLPKSSKNLEEIYSTNSRAVSEGFGITEVKYHDTESGQVFEGCLTNSSKHSKTCYFAQKAVGELQDPIESGKHTKRKAINQQEPSQNAPVLCSSLRSERGGANKRSRGRPGREQKFGEIMPSTNDSLKYEKYGEAGTVVWGTIIKSRWWPGITFEGPLAGQKLAKDGYVWILWFGDHKISQMNVKGLELFSNKYIDRCSGNLPSLLRSAISQAIMFCTKRAGIEMTNSLGDSFTETTWKFFDLVLKNKAYKDPSLPIDGEEMPAWFGNKLEALREQRSRLLTEIDERKCFSCQGYYTLVCKHPLFQKEICNECKESLQETLFAMDTDGSDMFCCICGFGYDSFMYVCSSESCKRSFCTKCLTSYIKEEPCQKIEKQKKWHCFLCTPYKRETHGSIKPDINHKQSALQFYKPTQLPCQQSLENNERFWPEKLRVLSVCDGVGTVKLILDDLGIDLDTYFSAETDADALAVLSRHHGAVINQLGDMTTLTRVKMKSLLPVDLIVCCPSDPDIVENPEILEDTDKVSPILKFAVMVKDLEVIAEGRPYLWLLVTSPALHVVLQKTLTNIFCVEPCLMSCEFIEECPYIKSRLCWSNIPEIYIEAANQKIINAKKCGIKLDWKSIIDSDTECQKAEEGGHDGDLKVELKRLRSCNKTKGKAANEEMIHMTTNHQKKAKISAFRFKNADIGSKVDEIERCMGFPTGYTKDVGLTSQQRAALLKETPCPRMLKVLLQTLTKYFKPNNKLN